MGLVGWALLLSVASSAFWSGPRAFFSQRLNGASGSPAPPSALRTTTTTAATPVAGACTLPAASAAESAQGFSHLLATSDDKGGLPWGPAQRQWRRIPCPHPPPRPTRRPCPDPPPPPSPHSSSSCTSGNVGDSTGRGRSPPCHRPQMAVRLAGEAILPDPAEGYGPPALGASRVSACSRVLEGGLPRMLSAGRRSWFLRKTILCARKTTALARRHRWLQPWTAPSRVLVLSLSSALRFVGKRSTGRKVVCCTRACFAPKPHVQ